MAEVSETTHKSSSDPLLTTAIAVMARDSSIEHLLSDAPIEYSRRATCVGSNPTPLIYLFAFEIS